MRRVIPFRNAHERRGEELAFLPAALEIVETPPSPIGRTIGATIILLFCAALVWAWWGTIDIVASATGKIVPSGRTKVIQPFETGVVRAIRVQDGQAVKAGDVLIELDPTVNGRNAITCATTCSPNSSTSRGCARRSPAGTIRWPTSRRPPMRTHR
jgi:hemolysin D